MCVNHGQWIKTVDGHWRPVMWPVRSVLGAPLAANKTNSQTLLIFTYQGKTVIIIWSCYQTELEIVT